MSEARSYTLPVMLSGSEVNIDFTSVGKLSIAPDELVYMFYTPGMPFASLVVGDTLESITPFVSRENAIRRAINGDMPEISENDDDYDSDGIQPAKPESD